MTELPADEINHWVITDFREWLGLIIPTSIVGTKLHQHTRKAIAKRTPALLTAIRKFNTYCDTLKREHKKSWKIPLPKHLPVELGALRNDPSLLTDVWVTPLTSPTPRWLDDPDVRRGIRAMLSKDRCLEERKRLGDEADNLCRWYGNELAAVELALRTSSCESNVLVIRIMHAA